MLVIQTYVPLKSHLVDCGEPPCAVIHGHRTTQAWISLLHVHIYRISLHTLYLTRTLELVVLLHCMLMDWTRVPSLEAALLNLQSIILSHFMVRILLLTH